MARKRRNSRAQWGTVRRRSSGNFTASYRHGGVPGVIASVEYRAPHSFETEGDARVWLARERRLIETDQWTPPADRVAAEHRTADPVAALTVAAYASRWLDQAEVRQTTRVLYERLLRLHILPELGDIPLVALDKARVALWWRSRDKTKQRTADLAYSLLRTILRAAVDDDLIAVSPAAVKGAGRPARRRDVDPLTPAQIEAIADAMPAGWRLGVLLGAWCALRSGEVRELRRKDIDLEKATIRVERGVVRVGGTLTAGAPKTDAAIRRVGVPAPLLPDVKRHLLDHAQLGAEGLLFWSDDGGHVSDNRWRRAWVKACEAAGVEGYTFHDLRHTGLTFAAHAGATVRELQSMGGHSTPTMALHYQGVAAGHMAEVVDRLGALMGRSSGSA